MRRLIQGFIPPGSELTRSGANPGDWVYVTGTLGDAGAGLDILQNTLEVKGEARDVLINRHYFPTPRVAVGTALRRIATSCIDISDGLLADLNNIIIASKCGAKIYTENIPFTNKTKKLLSLNKIDINYLLTCGEDYQLIFTAKISDSKKIISMAKENFVKITKIGNITKKKKLVVINKNNDELSFKHLGFKHF